MPVVIPAATHVFLLAVPIAVALGALLVFLRGERRER
jgi:hypothetical protein